MSDMVMTFKQPCKSVKELNQVAKAWKLQEGVLSVRVERFNYSKGGNVYVTAPYVHPMPDGWF